MKKVFEIVLLVLVGFTEATFPSSANATAIMNVIYDSFDIDAYTIWGENLYEPESLTKPLGTVDESELSGSLLSDGSNIYNASSYSNMAYANARITTNFGTDGIYAEVRTLLDDDIPGSTAGHGYAKSEWNLIFNIVGDGALFQHSGFGTDSNSNYWYNALTLFDMTTGLLYEGFMDVSLLDGHSYTLFAESVQRLSGLDESIEIDMYFANVHLNVQEPCAIVLLGSGLAVLGFFQRLQKSSFAS